MLYDALTTAAVCDELRATLVGGWVQKVIHLSEHSLGMEVYANQTRRWLLVSAHPQYARVNLVPEKLARDAAVVTPLLLLLRKHVRDSRLVEVSQPPLERLLALTFALSKGASDSEAETVRLIIEIMGRYSNVVLVDAEGLVMDSLRRVPKGVNRYRVILPRYAYAPPPPQGKLTPDQLDPVGLGKSLAVVKGDVPVWQVLVTMVAGMSPLLAREIVHRAAGDTKVMVAEAGPIVGQLVAIVRNLYAASVDHDWSPCIVRERGIVAAFAPYVLSHLQPAERMPTISAAVEAYYGDVRRFTPIEQAREKGRQELSRARSRHLRRKEALERAMERGAEAAMLRHNGEAILASIAMIGEGQSALKLDGATIELDPRLGPAENAQEYFRSYKKAKAAMMRVPALLSVETAALDFIDEIALQVELAGTADEVRRIVEDLAVLSKSSSAGKSADKPVKSAGKGRNLKNAKRAVRSQNLSSSHQKPYRVLPGGYEIFVGRSARQNEELTFRVAGPEDLWLHARKMPGAHVVVKAGGRSVPEDVVQAAAALAAAYSQAREGNRVAVDVAARKHVRHIPQGLPGLVSYTGERTVFVEPERSLS